MSSRTLELRRRREALLVQIAVERRLGVDEFAIARSLSDGRQPVQFIRRRPQYPRPLPSPALPPAA